MAITTNDNFDIRAPKLTDRRNGPFPSVEAAMQAINVNSRANGLPVIIASGESLEEYWFKNGQLVPKVAEATFNTTFKLVDIEETSENVGMIRLEPGYHMMKSTLNLDNVYIDGSTALPGTSGYLIIRQDDIASRRLYILPESNNLGTLGSVGTNNVLPRAVTTIHWYRDDEYCYWRLQDVVKGIYPTIKPVFRVDDVANTLEVHHQLPSSEMEISTNNGPWVQYTGTIYVGPVNRPAGYFRARVKDHPSRTTSPIAYSLPFNAVIKGFPYKFNFKLS